MMIRFLFEVLFLSTLVNVNSDEMKEFDENICGSGGGTSYVGDHWDCNTFYICHERRIWKLKCGVRSVWDDETSTCVPRGSISDNCSWREGIDDDDGDGNGLFSRRGNEPVCQSDSDVLLPHPEHCGQYYNCSSDPREDWWGEHLRECPYPFVFSATNLGCEPPNAVDCGLRKIPINPCDYLANQCRTSHCIPCHYRHASCLGLPDGLNPWLDKEWTIYFAICKNQRVIYQGECQQTEQYRQIFHPHTLVCTDERRLHEISSISFT